MAWFPAMHLLALATALLVVGASPPPPPPAPTATSSKAPSGRPRVLVLDVTGDLDEGARDTLTALVGARLARFSALDVVAKTSLARIVELEGEKQAAGCAADDGACLAEVANALDVDTVAVGTAGRLGGTTVFTLLLVDRGGRTVARGSTQVSALDDLAARVLLVIDDVGEQATGQPAEEPAVASDDERAATPRPSTAMPSLPVGSKQPLQIGGGVGAGVGALAVVVGLTPAVLYGGVAGDLRRLRVGYVERGGDDGILDEASKKQSDAYALQAWWNGAGLYAAWGGLALAVAGGGALAAGFLLEEAP